MPTIKNRKNFKNELTLDDAADDCAKQVSWVGEQGKNHPDVQASVDDISNNDKSSGDGDNGRIKVVSIRFPRKFECPPTVTATVVGGKPDQTYVVSLDSISRSKFVAKIAVNAVNQDKWKAGCGFADDEPAPKKKGKNDGKKPVKQDNRKNDKNKKLKKDKFEKNDDKEDVNDNGVNDGDEDQDDNDDKGKDKVFADLQLSWIAIAARKTENKSKSTEQEDEDDTDNCTRKKYGHKRRGSFKPHQAACACGNFARRF